MLKTEDSLSTAPVTAGTFPPTAVFISQGVPDEVCRLASDQAILVDGGNLIPVDYVVKENTATTTKTHTGTNQQQQHALESLSKWLSGTFNLACSRFHILVIGGNQQVFEGGSCGATSTTTSSNGNNNNKFFLLESEFDRLTRSICPDTDSDTILPSASVASQVFPPRRNNTTNQQQQQQQQQPQPMRIVSYFDPHRDFREYCFWNCDVLFGIGAHSQVISPETLTCLLSMSVSLGFAAVIWYPPKQPQQNFSSSSTALSTTTSTTTPQSSSRFSVDELAEQFSEAALQLLTWKRQFVRGMERTMAHRPTELLAQLEPEEYHLLLRDMVVSHRLTLTYQQEMLPFIDAVIERLSREDGGEGDETSSSDDEDDVAGDTESGEKKHENSLGVKSPVLLPEKLEAAVYQQDGAGVGRNSQPATPTSGKQILRDEIAKLQRENLALQDQVRKLQKQNDLSASGTYGSGSFHPRAGVSKHQNPQQQLQQDVTSSFSDPQQFEQEIIRQLRNEKDELNHQIDSITAEKDSEALRVNLRMDALKRELELSKRENDSKQSEISELKEKLVLLSQQQQQQQQASLVLASSSSSSRPITPSGSASFYNNTNNNNNFDNNEKSNLQREIERLKGIIENMDRALLEAERQNEKLQQEVVDERRRSTNATPPSPIVGSGLPTNNNNNNNNVTGATAAGGSAGVLTRSGSSGTSTPIINAIREQERSRVEKISKELEQTKQENLKKTTELFARIKKLSQELETEKENNKQQQDELKSAQQKQVVELERKIEELRKELKKQAEESSKIQEEIEKSLLETSEIEKNQIRSDADAKIFQLTEQLQNANRALQEQHQRISQLEESETNLVSQLERSTAEQQQQQSAAALTKQQLEIQICQLYQQLDSQQSEQESSTNSLLMSTREQREQLGQVQQQRDELLIEKSAQEQQIQDLLNKIKNLQSELEDSQQISEQWKRKHLAGIESIHQENEKKRAESVEKINALTLQRDTLSKELADKTSEIERISAELKDSEEKRQNLRNAHKATCDALVGAEERKNKLEYEVEQAARKMQDVETYRAVRELEATVNTQEAELIQLRSSNETALSELEMERRTNARLSLEIARFEQEFLKRSLDASDRVPVLMAELKRMKRVANEMALQVETLKDENEDLVMMNQSGINNNNSLNVSTATNNKNTNGAVLLRLEETQDALRKSEAQNSKLTQELQILHLQVSNLLDHSGLLTDAQKEAQRVAETAKLRATFNRFVRDFGGDQRDKTEKDNDEDNNAEPSRTPTKQTQQFFARNNSDPDQESVQVSPVTPTTPKNQQQQQQQKRSVSSPTSTRKKLLIDAAEYQRRELEWQTELRRLREENIDLANRMFESKVKQQQWIGLKNIALAGTPDAKKDRQPQNQKENNDNNTSSASHKHHTPKPEHFIQHYHDQFIGGLKSQLGDDHEKLSDHDDQIVSTIQKQQPQQQQPSSSSFFVRSTTTAPNSGVIIDSQNKQAANSSGKTRCIFL